MISIGTFDRKIINLTDTNENIIDTNSGIRVICTNEDGSRIFTSSFYDYSIQVWNPIDSTLIYNLYGHNDTINTIIYDKYFDRIISGSDDFTIKIWILNQLDPILSLEDHQEPINSICIDYNGGINSKIISGSDDCTIKIWDFNSEDPLNTLDLHTEAVNVVCFDNDLKIIISGGNDNNIFCTDINTGMVLKNFNDHLNAIISICCDENNKKLYSSSFGEFKIRNYVSGDIYYAFYTTFTINYICINNDGSQFFVLTNDEIVKIINSETNEIIREINEYAAVSICYTNINYDILLK